MSIKAMIGIEGEGMHKMFLEYVPRKGEIITLKESGERRDYNVTHVIWTFCGTGEQLVIMFTERREEYGKE